MIFFFLLNLQIRDKSYLKIFIYFENLADCCVIIHLFNMLRRKISIKEVAELRLDHLILIIALVVEIVKYKRVLFEFDFSTIIYVYDFIL